jgi:hypothetical protein
MATVLNDDEIALLIQEPKPLPDNYMERFQLKPKRGHRERELEIVGENGSEFRLILRQSGVNPLDFSVILAYCVPGSSQVVRLRRYNGKSHEHTNTIERSTFYNFHIHEATERYQLLGSREDGFATSTDRYADFQAAVQCMIEDCNFVVPLSAQAGLF